MNVHFNINLIRRFIGPAVLAAGLIAAAWMGLSTGRIEAQHIIALLGLSAVMITTASSLRGDPWSVQMDDHAITVTSLFGTQRTLPWSDVRRTVLYKGRLQRIWRVMGHSGEEICLPGRWLSEQDEITFRYAIAQQISAAHARKRAAA